MEDFRAQIDSAAVSAYGARFSQIDVGAMVGLSRSAVARILRRHYFPSMHNPETVYNPAVGWDWLNELDDDAAQFRRVLRNGPCGLCGAPGPSQLDHIEPKSSGGTHTWDNFGALCGRCNASKSTKQLLHALLA